MIQAKRLYGRGANWQHYEYKQLLHRGGGRLQAAILCDAARREAATYPLYTFYNPARSCTAARNAGVNTVEGVNLAGGYAVERLVTTAITSSQQQNCKRLKAIEPLMFSLAKLFCPHSLHVVGPFSYVGRNVGPFFIANVDGDRQMGIPVPPMPEEFEMGLLALTLRKCQTLLMRFPQMS